nr:serine/arginine repetitive matrix protein 2-like [Ipomoea batatas]
MSDTDSQNVSARDYDDMIEATPTDVSSANSNRSSREVGEVGAAVPQRGKSPRAVVSHLHDQFPNYSPVTQAILTTNLPPRPTASEAISVPASAQPSSSQPSATGGGDFVPLNSDDVRNHPCLLTLSELEETKTLLTGHVEFQTRRSLGDISAESYEYWVFRSAESVRAAQLEPPDYGRPEKYVPKRMTGPSASASAPETTDRGMVLERSFAPAPSGPKKPRPKVTLGGSKAIPAPEATTEQAVPPTLPSGSTGGPKEATDLQVARTTNRRKEKAVDPDVEEIPLKSVIPTREAIRDLETDQVGEMIAQNVLWLSHMTNDLFCRAKAAENVVRKEVLPLKESLAKKDKELNDKAEKEVEATKLESAELNERMSSYANLTGFLCRDPQEAEAFFRSFIHNGVGEGLAWHYGEWAYAKGRYEMQREIHEALEESLNEKDLSTIMGVVPDPVPSPGPMPYADPASDNEARPPAQD